MKKLVYFLIALSMTCKAKAQKDPSISADEVKRIETTLSADDMQGRRAGSPGIDKAARFIVDEFKKAGLQPLKGDGFLQEFSMNRARLTSLKLEMEGQEIDAKNIVVLTTQPEIKIDEKSGYEVRYIKAGENLRSKARTLLGEGKNIIVLVDTSFSSGFLRLTGLKQQLFKMQNNVVFILGNYPMKKFTLKAEHAIDETKYANVVGILPGKSRKNEYVIFSGHYDHLGIARQAVNGDSIYNGANDDAAGTTAVIMLANYFKKLNNNERTIVFAAFTAEEVGGFGSQYFSQQFDPKEVVAMFNIEMIGTESKWGRNSAYITGYEKTNMGDILKQNLQGSSFSFYPDPYPDQNLFYRSDNATLARLGVPAHTISTSKMDSEPNYHKLSDEISTLDIENMTEIIRAIALSSRSIVNGKDTPSKVKVEDLR